MMAGVVLAAALLAGCSSGGGLTPTPPSESPSPSASMSESTGPSASESSSPTPSTSPTKIVAVLCDTALPRTVKAIEASLKEGYSVSELGDVRRADSGPHAVIALISGPGVAGLGIWTGDGLSMAGLASADSLSQASSTAPLSEPAGKVADLVGQTITCHDALYK